MRIDSLTGADEIWLERTLWRHLSPFTNVHVNTTLADNDQMFTWSQRHHQNASIALSQYYSVAIQQYRTLHQLLKWKFGAVENVESLLDFASGFGRLIRLLSIEMPPSKIWVSDIQADAVEFQTQQFGVNGIVSTESPESFDPGRTFDCIFVASLFSHLPEDSFENWLRKLYALLRPNGILCFSIHDEVLLGDASDMPASGFKYTQGSEIDTLAAEKYGTTHVTEPYMRSAIRRVTGGEHFARIKRALAYMQDMYILEKGNIESLSSLTFQYGPWGWIDKAVISAPGRLSLYGWAVDVDWGPPIQQIEVRLNSAVVQVCMPSIRRDDVRDHFGDQSMGLIVANGEARIEMTYDTTGFETCGWECSVAFLDHQLHDHLEVSILSSSGERGLLYAGELAGIVHG